MDKIIFTDMAKSEEKERQRLRERLSILERRLKLDGALDPELEKERREIRYKLRDELTDDEFKGDIEKYINFAWMEKQLAATKTTVSAAKTARSKAQASAQTFRDRIVPGIDAALQAELEKNAADADQEAKTQDDTFKAETKRASDLSKAIEAAKPDADQAQERLIDLMKERLTDVIKEAAKDTEVYVAYKAPHLVDPYYLGIQHTLQTILRKVLPIHKDGIMPSQMARNPLTDEEKAIAAVFGILSLDNQTNPDLERFVPAVSTALGEYTQSKSLFDKVLDYVAEGSDMGKERKLGTDQWISVGRSLRNEGKGPDHPQLRLLSQRLLSSQTAGDGSESPTELIDISLPDFEEVTAIEIVSDNLKAVKAVYFSAMLEETRMFQVVDKLVELFQYGMLPLGKGGAGGMLYDYWKSSPERISEIERRNLYSRVFGFVGGDPGQGNPNREFNDLMLRFISAVSSYVRQFTVDNMLRSSIAVAISQEQVRKAGRDLAANLSLHGYGIAFFFATELRNQINTFKRLLSDSEIKNAYGARDMWQVIEQVSTLELGGARNVTRYRTMAQSGAVIIAWLAKKADLLTAPAHIGLLDLDEIRKPIQRNKDHRPTEDPTDVDLVNACEQWLAVTGTPDHRVEEYAQPIEGPTITSRPIQIPSAARDLLESVGVTAGYSGNGNRNGNGRH